MAENKWLTGVITPISGLITLLTTGRGPTLLVFLYTFGGVFPEFFFVGSAK